MSASQFKIMEKDAADYRKNWQFKSVEGFCWEIYYLYEVFFWFYVPSDFVTRIKFYSVENTEIN